MVMTHLVAELCSPVWQKRKRTSFRPLENAYRADIVGCSIDGIAGGAWWFNGASMSRTETERKRAFLAGVGSDADDGIGGLAVCDRAASQLPTAQQRCTCITLHNCTTHPPN